MARGRRVENRLCSVVEANACDASDFRGGHSGQGDC